MATRLALIPPYAWLEDIVGRSLQMMLPACMSEQGYIGAFRRARQSNPNTHIVLDNGMYEAGSPIDNAALLSLALRCDADEIVLPDVRNDPVTTLDMQIDFLQNTPGISVFKGTFMATVQVDPRDSLSALQYVHEVFKHLPAERTVLGFPRKLTEDYGPTGRLDLMEAVARQYGKVVRFHMLGASRESSSELLRAVRQFGDYLRGIDTCAPYVWAAAGKKIDECTGLQRPDDYFFLRYRDIDPGLLAYNLDRMEQWVRGLT